MIVTALSTIEGPFSRQAIESLNNPVLEHDLALLLEERRYIPFYRDPKTRRVNKLVYHGNTRSFFLLVHDEQRRVIAKAHCVRRSGPRICPAWEALDMSFRRTEAMALNPILSLADIDEIKDTGPERILRIEVQFRYEESFDSSLRKFKMPFGEIRNTRQLHRDERIRAHVQSILENPISRGAWLECVTAKVEDGGLKCVPLDWK